MLSIGNIVDNERLDSIRGSDLFTALKEVGITSLDCNGGDTVKQVLRMPSEALYTIPRFKYFRETKEKLKSFGRELTQEETDLAKNCATAILMGVKDEWGDWWIPMDRVRTAIGEYGWEALFCSFAMNGNFARVKYMVESGVNVCCFGDIALTFSRTKQHTDTSNYLESAGANANESYANYINALMDGIVFDLSWKYNRRRSYALMGNPLPWPYVNKIAGLKNQKIVRGKDGDN